MKKKIMVIIGSILLLAIGSISFVAKMKSRSLIPPNVSYSLPEGVDSSYIEKMSKLGMNTTKESKMLRYIIQRKYWKDSCGLMFLGDDEMSEFLENNDFVLAPADRYKKVIPAAAGNTLFLNIEKVKSFNRPIYTYWAVGVQPVTLNKEDVIIDMPDGWTFDFGDYRDIPNGLSGIITKYAILKSGIQPSIHCYLRRERSITNIMIIGGVKEFNTAGMELKNNIFSFPPKDPIAVVKVQDGYVELANWE